MKNDSNLISIIIPLYNEEKSLLELYQNLEKEFADNLNYEIIFVDDGSIDNSWSVIRELFHNKENIRAVSLRHNCGKSPALVQGFKEARGEIVITMDADLQDNPRDIINLKQKIEGGFDVVVGWKKRKASFFRLILTKVFNFFVSISTGIKIHDFNCSLKAYRKNVLWNIKLYGELHRFLPVLAYWQGFKVGEVRVDNFERKYGKSKYGLERIWRGFFDLVSILFIKRYGKKPLHLFGSVGLIVFLIGLGIDSYMTVLRFQGERIGDRPLFMLGTLMIIVGVQIFSIGLLGEWLNYSMHKNDAQDTPIKKILKK